MPFFLSAQSNSTVISARAMGVGNASSALSDEWSLLNNPGGISTGKKELTAAFSLHAIPNFQQFNRMAAVFSLPTKFGTAAAGVYRFGDDLYHEQFISAGFGNTFGIASLGIRMNYIEYYAEGFGTGRFLTVGFGGIAKITSMLSVGAYISNINQPKISSEERIPSRMAVSLGFSLSEKLFATTEIEKDSRYDPLLKAGLEYALHERVKARTGFNVNPQAAFAGLGFRIKKFTLDYAVQSQRQLGFNHQATVSWRISSSK